MPGVVRAPVWCSRTVDCLIQDNYLHNVDRTAITVANYATNTIVRRNTSLTTYLDPNMYIVGANGAQVYGNVLLHKRTPPERTHPQDQY